MIEKHQILIDGLVDISRGVCNPIEVSKVTLQTYMGANNLESDERSFLPGYHQYVTAHCYDVKHGYLNIEYSIPLSVWPKNQQVQLEKRYRKTHSITQLNWTTTHLIVLIEML